MTKFCSILTDSDDTNPIFENPNVCVSESQEKKIKVGKKVEVILYVYC